MTRMHLLMFAGMLFIIAPAHAKTADQLKSELQAISPPGKKVRVVWSHSLIWSASGGVEEDWTIYGVDSDDGQIRELTPKSLFSGNSRMASHPFLTRDGQRVVFKEENSTSLYVIDWDGQNLTMLMDEGCLGATWQDPVNTDKQYAMIAEINGTWLINIDDPNDRTKVWNGDLCDGGWGGTAGVGISVDGQRIGGYICNNSSCGIAPVPDGAPACLNYGGCNFAMRPTPPGVYEWNFFSGYDCTICGHSSVVVRHADGTAKAEYDIVTNLRQWAQQNGKRVDGEPVILNWTNDTSYVTYQWQNSELNPVLYSIDGEWVAMQDDLDVDKISPQHCNAVFLPASGTRVADGIAGSAPAHQAAGKSSVVALYTITGRKLGGEWTGTRRRGAASSRVFPLVRTSRTGSAAEVFITAVESGKLPEGR